MKGGNPLFLPAFLRPFLISSRSPSRRDPREGGRCDVTVSEAGVSGRRKWPPHPFYCVGRLGGKQLSLKTSADQILGVAHEEKALTPLTWMMEVPRLIWDNRLETKAPVSSKQEIDRSLS